MPRKRKYVGGRSLPQGQHHKLKSLLSKAPCRVLNIQRWVKHVSWIQGAFCLQVEFGWITEGDLTIIAKLTNGLQCTRQGSKGFIGINSFNQWDSITSTHFIHEEIKAKRKLPNEAWLIRCRVRIGTQTVWLQTPHSSEQ